ncbi:leucine-rich repeat-containing protein 59 [Aplysia californica]|uniref:Leucine-rich repeat-containing protein 59 n=1 Tax=Aplysia californica TaxID=6500 RepID=A0ABM1A8G8_APLCA|nr:leucine-rich repeat-containing protein 59 [Aplysia californica]
MYMKDLDSQLERQWQKKLQKKREDEARQKELEEKEKQKKRQEKKAEKERRRREHEVRREQEILAQSGDTSDEDINREREKQKYNGSHKAGKRGKGKKGGSCVKLVLFSFLALIIALLVAIDFHCNASQRDQLCITYWHPARSQVLAAWTQSKIFLTNFYHRHIEKLFF